MGMKRRYLAVLMGIMVATTSVPAMVYAEDSKTVPFLLHGNIMQDN